MSDFDHGLNLSHLTVWPPQPTTLAGIGLIALAIFQPELAIPALVAGLVAIIGDDKTHLDRKTPEPEQDRKSTRLNSSHVKISYAVFCLKKKKAPRERKKKKEQRQPHT